MSQEIPAERVSVPFGDPSRPGRVKADLKAGGITVRGYDGKEVMVEAWLRGSKQSTRESRKGEDLKPVQIATSGLTVEEEENVISVGAGSKGCEVDLKIQVPRATSLKLGCVNDGNILVENVEGEIEANNQNGSVTLTNVSGVVVAHSLNGSVVTQMEKVEPGKPMSFSSLNGDIDVTLPAAIEATVKMETQQGSIDSDFDIELDKNPRQPSLEGVRHKGGKNRSVFDKRLVGSINGGGAVFQFKTVNGSIHIRKGK